MLDCSTCKAQVDEAVRREMACGFLPPSATTGMRWSAEGELQLSTCAGYTTQLPDVQDARGVYIHHQVGALAAAAGSRPPPALLDLLARIKGSANGLEAKMARDAAKGKG